MLEKKTFVCYLHFKNRTLQHCSHILLPTPLERSLDKMSLLRHWTKKAKENNAARNNNTPSSTSKEYTKEPEGKKRHNF